MKAVLQRVKQASCHVDNKLISEIGQGFLILAGFGPEDDEQSVRKVAEKAAVLRVFSDSADKMNLSIQDVKGSILSVSQFTLYADCRHGRRPSFIGAAEPEKAKRLYAYFNDCLREAGLSVKEGVFGADMKIALVNDGPVTIVLESGEL